MAGDRSLGNARTTHEQFRVDAPWSPGRFAGHLDTRSNLSGYRVNRELTREPNTITCDIGDQVKMSTDISNRHGVWTRNFSA